MFGGNFNRIKNLMVNNGGLYISPDFTDFSKKGNDDVFSVMSEIRKSSPKVKFFLSCGSSG